MKTKLRDREERAIGSFTLDRTGEHLKKKKAGKKNRDEAAERGEVKWEKGATRIFAVWFKTGNRR